MRRIAPALLLAAAAAWGSDCTRTSVGFAPFTDPYPPAYHGQGVSLYPVGNRPPAAHQALGLELAAQIAPRNVSGSVDPNGTIVLLSIGMSNTTQEFSAFLPLAMADPRRNPRVLPVDGAVGGETAARIASSPEQYWSQVETRLRAAGVTDAQVQVAWLKEADAQPTQTFPQDAELLRQEIATVIEQARSRFPNLKIVYLSSRIYAGYATTALNPEPYAYQTGFAVKGLIAAQIGGDPSLDAASGKAPWLAWGPYLWADGLQPRFDGLTWACEDLNPSDGTHPGASGRLKVAAMLLDFLHGDATARPWYLAPPDGGAAPTIGAVVNPAGYGAAVATGAVATIFGKNLAAAPAAAPGYPLPHELAGTRVEIDGAPALLYYVSPQQINFVLPAEGGRTLQVFRGAAASEVVSQPIVYWAPGLFTFDGAPHGPVTAVHADGRLVTPSTPARRGETIRLYGTGLGIVNPMLLIATPAPIVRIAGLDAVTRAARAPEIPGVTTIDVTVPAAAPAGPAVPIVFGLGAATSNAASIAIGE